MRHRLFASLVMFSIAGFQIGQAATPCPDVRTGDEKRSAKLGISLSLVSKLLSALSIAPEYEEEVKTRLPEKAEQILALAQFRVVCVLVYEDVKLSTLEKIKILREEVASIMLVTKIGPTSTLRPGSGTVSPVALWRLPDPPFYALLTTALPSPLASLPPPPAAPPPRGATIIRVFPKKNLDILGVVKLRRLMPNFDVRIGSSTIAPANVADTLFVDRDRVPPDQVLDVLRTLREMGIPIKSIQQSKFGRAEIQIGTVLDPATGSQLLASTHPLDVDKMSTLSGSDFWRAGFNGLTTCPTGVGHFVFCTPSADDARPLRTEGSTGGQPRPKSQYELGITGR